MNLKLVLRTYAALRQLSDDETALLTTLRNLNDSEREQLVESLVPTKGTGKGLKKTRKSREKSPRASSLQKQLQVTGKGTGNGHCVFEVTGGDGLRETCDATANDPIHDQSFGYAGYHEFQAAGS